MDLDDKISRQESSRLLKRRNSRDESNYPSKKSLDINKENIFVADLLQTIDNSSSSEDPIVIDEENITTNADARSQPFSRNTFSNPNTPTPEKHNQKQQVLLESKVVPVGQAYLDDSVFGSHEKLRVQETKFQKIFDPESFTFFNKRQILVIMFTDKKGDVKIIREMVRCLEEADAIEKEYEDKFIDVAD